MPSVFGCIPSRSRYGNVPNELIRRVGPPFLDNHYRGYQLCTKAAQIKKIRNIKMQKDRNGYSNHQKVMKQVMRQVPMHRYTYIATEAMTTKQITVELFYAMSNFKLQATQISTVTVASQYITGLTL